MADLDTVIVVTADAERLAAFYRDGFDLGEPERDEGHVGFQLGTTYLGFDAVGEPPAAPGAVSLWFRVDDLEAAFARFTAIGAEVRFPPADRPWGDRIAAVFDPDGNTIGLSQRR